MLVRQGRSVFINAATFRGAYNYQQGSWADGSLRNRFAGGFDQKFGGYPSGSYHPGAYIPAQKAGAISSYRLSSSALSTFGNITPAMPMNASSSMALAVLNSQLDQVVQLIASAVLSITGNANIAAAVAAQATAAMTLAGSALAGGIFPIDASSSMNLSPGVSLTAQAFMEAAAGGPTPLSPEGLANAVLDALLADHTDAGSVGEALNNIGASSNPWSADLASNNSAGSFGERIQKILTKTQFMGLK